MSKSKRNFRYFYQLLVIIMLDIIIMLDGLTEAIRSALSLPSFKSQYLITMHSTTL